MKILCLVALLVCAFAHGADVEREDVVTYGEKQIEDLHFYLNLLSPDHEVTEDDKLLANELQQLDIEGRNLVADALARMIEDFRDVVINGNENLPPLDPLYVPLIGPFELQAPATRLTAEIRNLGAEGLRWYVLDNMSFNALRLSFSTHITVPWITVTGSYDARARLALINHNAGGAFRIFAHRIEVGMDMRLGTNLFGGHLVLRELDIKVDIHDTQIQIHGLTGSSVLNALINSLVQNITQDLIQSELENVSQLLSEGLFDTINEVLKDYTISDILG